MDRFRELYNGEDMERFVTEAYAASFIVLNLDGSSWTASRANRQNLVTDPETFLRSGGVHLGQGAEAHGVRRLIPWGTCELKA